MSALSIQSVFCLGNPDTGDQGDLTLSLHHLAGLWGPRVSCLLPQLPVQGAGDGLSKRGPGACGGALQCWYRAIGNLLPCGHLPGSGGYWSTSWSNPPTVSMGSLLLRDVLMLRQKGGDMGTFYGRGFGPHIRNKRLDSQNSQNKVRVPHFWLYSQNYDLKVRILRIKWEQFFFILSFFRTIWCSLSRLIVHAWHFVLC